MISAKEDYLERKNFTVNIGWGSDVCVKIAAFQVLSPYRETSLIKQISKKSLFPVKPTPRPGWILEWLMINSDCLKITAEFHNKDKDYDTFLPNVRFPDELNNS